MDYKIVLSKTFRRDFSAHIENLKIYRSKKAPKLFAESIITTEKKLSLNPYIGREGGVESVRSVHTTGHE